MRPESIKEVYLANKKIDVDGVIDIFDTDWHKHLSGDGLYCLRAYNDLCVYRIGEYVFELDPNKKKIELVFRERVKK